MRIPKRYVCIYIYIHVYYMCVYVYVCIYIYIYISVCVCRLSWFLTTWLSSGWLQVALWLLSARLISG